MTLIRIALISLAVYLLVRSFLRYKEDVNSSAVGKDPEKNNANETKKVSKKIGEYIDYEELKK
jgi:hypothetical protein